VDGKVQTSDKFGLFIHNTHMKKDDLVKVIRAIVKQEIKKELPTALAQVFAQMMGQAQKPQIHSMNMVRNLAPSTPPVPQPELPEVDETANLKAQLQEMFAGGVSIQRAQPQTAPQMTPQMRTFTKDPVLNEVLNQTRGFNSSERMANRVGGMGAGMSPAVAMAASGYSSSGGSTTGAGEMMEGQDLGFLQKIPGMPGADAPVIDHIPTSRGMVQEGHAPLEAMGAVSALDLKNHPALPDSIKGILTRDYRSLVRAMDKGKKK